MNKMLLKIIIVICAVCIVGLFVVVSGINNVISMEETVKSAWAQVENVLQRRYDLIPNYVETVKGYAKHEKDVFVNVTQARAKVANSSTVKEKIDSNADLSSALARLLVVVEQYPQLKADQNFRMLQYELAGTENRISVERRRYNESVRELNSYIRRIPGRLYASIMGISQRPYFEVKEEAKQAPKVSF